MNETALICFTIYSILYEAIIWGVFGYAVFYKDCSSWWILLAVIMSGAQFKPNSFKEFFNG
jgi:hypothetical protein